MNALRRLWARMTECRTYTLTTHDIQQLREMTPEQRAGWFTALYLGFGRYDKEQS
ncbi:hypothetical protein J7E70_08000 [Variovorax paradoxus]|nr:hypothetical protein [Variovorax paradoxus]MBT2300406.1 hypothetical protein [Variovorax paradoxus]